MIGEILDYDIKNPERLLPCPKCQKNNGLKFRTQQSSEDTVDVWVFCECGFDPTKNNSGQRIETVSGINELFAAYAASSWNEEIKHYPT